MARFHFLLWCGRAARSFQHSERRQSTPFAVPDLWEQEVDRPLARMQGNANRRGTSLAAILVETTNKACTAAGPPTSAPALPSCLAPRTTDVVFNSLT